LINFAFMIKNKFKKEKQNKKGEEEERKSQAKRDQ
jgi:hypothetical protein